MSRRSRALQARRLALQQQCALQRREVAWAAARLRAHLQPLERAVRVFHHTRNASVAVGGAAALALALLSGRAMGAVGRISLAVTTLRRLWSLLGSAADGSPAHRQR